MSTYHAQNPIPDLGDVALRKTDSHPCATYILVRKPGNHQITKCDERSENMQGGKAECSRKGLCRWNGQRDGLSEEVSGDPNE